MLMYLTLALALWLFMDQASSLMLSWESSFRDGGPVEILFDLYKQTTITRTCINDTRNYSIRGKYSEMHT